MFDSIMMPFYTKGGETVVVPDVKTLTFEEAKNQLAQKGLEARVGYNRYDPQASPNTVLTQNPGPGAKVKSGRHVYLSINTEDRPPSNLPDLRGRSLVDAKLSLERLGFKVGRIEYSVVYKESDDGIVLSQSIPASTLLKVGTPVSLSVGKIAATEEGEKQSLVPDVSGRSLTESQKLIVESGYTLGEVHYHYSASLVPGTVIEQEPKSGEVAPLGKPIDLTVSTSNKSDETSQ
ncbi:MAG: PASTA domain-containing protein [Chlorobiales bacterium]|nr:PASTA domain-containing protein [Chlorobiales bacterium]